MILKNNIFIYYFLAGCPAKKVLFYFGIVRMEVMGETALR